MTQATKQVLDDGFGSTVNVGNVLKGFGLNNAGRYYSVIAVGKSGRVRVQRHVDNKEYWVFLRALSARVVS